MKFVIEYDNEINGDEFHDLDAVDIPVLGIEPYEVRDSHVAYYDFPEGTSEDEIIADLDNSNWCFRGAYPFQDNPEP